MDPLRPVGVRRSGDRPGFNGPVSGDETIGDPSGLRAGEAGGSPNPLFEILNGFSSHRQMGLSDPREGFRQGIGDAKKQGTAGAWEGMRYPSNLNSHGRSLRGCV